MKITPYLLWLNGFQPYTGRQQCWYREEKSPLSGHTIEMQVEPACINGLWLVRYGAMDTSCACYLKTFQDLMALSEIFARNRHGYSDVNPIEIYVPTAYTSGDWIRGDYDQATFDEYKYRYINE